MKFIDEVQTILSKAQFEQSIVPSGYNKPQENNTPKITIVGGPYFRSNSIFDLQCRNLYQNIYFFFKGVLKP